MSRLKTDKAIFIALSLVAFIYAALRAAYVPVVHDEAATFFHYVQLDSYIPWHALWDANNHILNSALAHASVNIFNDGIFWLRLPNLLCFILFAYFLNKLASLCKNNFVRWLLILAMLTASFQLEFFSFARGYGMSSAFLLGAIWSASQYLNEHRLRDQWLTWLYMLLALLSNMSLMNTLTALGGIFVLHLIFIKKERRFPHYFSLLLGGGILFSAAAYYAMKLKVLGLLYTGSTAGFVQVTAWSFAKYQFGMESMAFAYFISIVTLSAASFILWRTLSEKKGWGVGALIALLLVLNFCGSVLLEILMGVNYPEERTGIYFLTLFILTIAFAADGAASGRAVFKWLAFPLIYFPLELLATANLYTSHLWADLHINDEVYQNAAILQSQSDIPLRISGRNMYGLSWAYYNLVNGNAMPLMETQYYPDTAADLIIAWPGFIDFHTLNCDTVYIHHKSKFALLKPKAETKTKSEILAKTDYTTYSGTAPYLNLASWETGTSETGVISMQFSATEGAHVILGQVVITSQDSLGRTLTYDYIPLHWIRKHWKGETYHLLRSFHFPEDSFMAIVYFWNISNSDATLQFNDIVVERFLPENTNP